MNLNMGVVDRIIRILIAIVIGVLYFTNRISGTLAIVLAVVAIVFLITGCSGRCPAYIPFGLSTSKKQSPPPPT